MSSDLKPGFVASLFTGALLALSSDCMAGNPFITSIYTADPSAHVWSDGRLYVYPSHDMDPPRGCDLMDRYHVFSTEDMANWRDEGEILRADQVSWGRTEGGFMWAPDCAFKDGKYFFYFPHPSGSSWNETWKIGVAISSHPAGGFTNAGFITGVGGFSMIDPCVFVDTDGQAFLYYGGGGKCDGGRLKACMTEIDGTMQRMEGLADFHEAPWIFRRNGLYYLTYADNNPGANRLHYATSSSPLGPWAHKGIYLTPTDCDTSHGSVVEYKGQWYAFYHNKSISGQGTLRSICVDRLYFNDDGTIREVVQTKTGVPSVGRAPGGNPALIRYEAENATMGNGVTIGDDDGASGHKAVQNLHLMNSYLEFARVNGGRSGGRATIEVFHAAKANARLRLTVNGVDYSFLNALSTGDWNAYTGRSSLTVTLQPGGDNTIRLTGGDGGVNVDYINVSLLPR
jgi:beta-xylosidase